MQGLNYQVPFLIIVIIILIMPVPVNAQINDTFIYENRVDENTAYNIAIATLNPYSENSFGDSNFGCDNFSGSYVRKINKLDVYDVLSGELLYYEFDVMKKGDLIGYVRVAGNKLLGTIALSVGCNGNLKENLTHYYEIFEKQGDSPVIISYGTYNALLIRGKNGTDIDEYIYDVYSCEKIPLDRVQWSYFLNLDENTAKNNIEKWEKGYFSLVIVEDAKISGDNLHDSSNYSNNILNVQNNLSTDLSDEIMKKSNLNIFMALLLVILFLSGIVYYNVKKR